jgi:hypothetical protein
MQIPHPHRLPGALSDEELLDWWCYYQCDPWGEQRDDYRAFMSTRGQWSEEIMPEWPYVEAPMTPEEFKEAMQNGG